jgi:hypothetical protein
MLGGFRRDRTFADSYDKSHRTHAVLTPSSARYTAIRQGRIPEGEAS